MLCGNSCDNVHTIHTAFFYLELAKGRL